jgi:hypothetical protein
MMQHLRIRTGEIERQRLAGLNQLRFTFGIVEEVVPPYVPKLDFSDARNSQYAPLVFFGLP